MPVSRSGQSGARGELCAHFLDVVAGEAVPAGGVRGKGLLQERGAVAADCPVQAGPEVGVGRALFVLWVIGGEVVRRCRQTFREEPERAGAGQRRPARGCGSQVRFVPWDGPALYRLPCAGFATRVRTPGDRRPVRRHRTTLAEWATKIHAGNASRVMATFRNLVIALAHLVVRNNQGVVIDHSRSDSIHVRPHHAQWLKMLASW